MPEIWEEYISMKGQTGGKPWGEATYGLKGYANRSAVDLAVRGYAPSGMTINSQVLGIETIDIEETETINQMWKARVKWSSDTEPKINDWGMSFDFQTGSEKITVAREHIDDRIRAGHAIPDWLTDGVLNVDRKTGIAKGIDIPTAKAVFTVKWSMESTLVTTAYLRTLFALCSPAHVNDALFYGAEAGELLFVGANGQLSGRNINVYEINFRFWWNPNVYDYVISTLPAFDKQGWYAITTETDFVLSAGGGRKKPILMAVHIDRVFDEGDFSTIGIGSGTP